MNREQRRHPAPGPKNYTIPPVNIQYGINNECVILLFSAKTGGLALSPANVDDMIAKLRDVKQRLIEHRKKIPHA